MNKLSFEAFIERKKAKDEWDSGPPIEYDDEYIADLREAWEAALAQQAQPLTDQDGVDYFVRCIGAASYNRVSGLGKHEAAHPKTIRRVLEETKAIAPEAADVIASMVFFRSLDISREAFLARDRMAQQAQPEMPTPEQVSQALVTALPGTFSGYESGLRKARDAMLALFAPKETFEHECPHCHNKRKFTDPDEANDWVDRCTSNPKNA